MFRVIIPEKKCAVLDRTRFLKFDGDCTLEIPQTGRTTIKLKVKDVKITWRKEDAKKTARG